MGNVTFSVDLQDPISYSFYILITGVALMLISAVIYIAFFRLWKVQRDENGLVKAKRTRNDLISVMEVYSAPEFSRYGRGDLSRDISDTKRAIQTWR